MAFATGIAGGNLTQVDVAPAPFAVGNQTLTSDGGMAEYVFAFSGISQFDAVGITTSGNARPITTTLAATINKIGFAQTAIASGSFGWVLRSGYNISVNGATSCAQSVKLYTTATGGVLDDAVVTAGMVLGVISASSITTAAPVLIVAGVPAVTINAVTG